MKKADLRKNHLWFEGQVMYYDDFFNRTINAQKVLTLGDKREIAESSLLRLCAYWESFVDQELVDCSNINCSQLQAYVGVRLPKHLSIAMCEAILFGRGYLSFRSVGDTKGVAKKVSQPA